MNNPSTDDWIKHEAEMLIPKAPQPTDDARNAGPHEIDRKALNDMQQKATSPVDDTNHRRNTELVASYAAAPEPVESIEDILNSIRAEIHIEVGKLPKYFLHTSDAETRLSRLLVQAKLEEAHLSLSMNEGSQDAQLNRIAALQSQLEGAAGVAIDKPVVPPEVERNGGEPSA